MEPRGSMSHSQGLPNAESNQQVLVLPLSSLRSIILILSSHIGLGLLKVLHPEVLPVKILK
jgi:hypothetical protein